eukprot:gene28026-36908_t
MFSSKKYISKRVSICDYESSPSTSSSVGILPPWFPSFATACLGGLLFGLDIGSSSSVVRILGAGQSEFGTLDPIQLGQIASSSLLGAMLSSGLIIFIGDKFIGRKNELQIASVLFTVGTLVQSLSTSFPVALVGRVLYGLGIGTAMHVAPLFIAETSPNDLRGRLVSFKEAAIVLGIVAGYGAGAFFGESNNWHGVFQSALPFEALMLAGSLVVPESPRWLALRGRKEEAVTALISLQALPEEQAAAQVSEMMLMSSTTASATTATTPVEEDGVTEKMKEIFTSPYNRRALFIGLGLVLFQQLSGQPSVLYFANRIFEQAGLGFEAALFIGVFKLAMTFVSAYLVENPNFGRRTLLLYGNTGVTVSLLLLSFFYLGGDPSAGSGLDAEAGLGLASFQQAAIIASMLLFVGSYQIGFGPISWLILSEIFPLRIRSAAVSLGTLANFSSNLLVTLLFEAERLALGESLLFLQFGLVGLAATLFTFFYVFETRGLSLEDIETKLKSEVDKT